MAKRTVGALGVDDIVSQTYYFKVAKADPRGNTIIVRDLDRRLGSEIEIRGTPLIESLVSADSYQTTVKVTRGEMARLLTGAGSKPFTVEFVKSDGEDRTLRGVLVEHEDLMGRSSVRDLDIEQGMPLRQVDHRTIFSLILAGVKYTLKK